MRKTWPTSAPSVPRAPTDTRRPSLGLWQAESGAASAPSAPVNRSGSAGTFNRDEALRRLEEEHFDVLVIGGGITGAGVALDAASRGLRTALVERHDFASGTSSKSSKLVHGGLRYLQQRDFRLVYEALHERQILLENAPHLVVPLPFLIPLFGRDGVVNKAVSRTYSTALWMYDLTGGWRIGKRHQRIGRDEALSHLPTLKADRLVAAFIYYDARTDDARLTLAVARTAALQHGAVMVNYAEVTGLLHRQDGRVAGAKVRAWTPTAETAATPATAARSGAPPSSEQTAASNMTTDVEVKAAVVINATGVWADDVRALDEATHPHSLRPAKGIHVTVPRSRIPADIAAVIPARADRRQIFVVPWPDGDDVYLGTTDTDWDGPLDDPACLPQDIDYVLEAANGSTTSSLTRADVTGVWAGLRPLLDPGDRHVSARTKDLSRRHTVHVSEHGVVTVTGGKMTTYRLMAEQTVDAAVKVLGVAVSKSPTRHLKLIGAPANTGRGANGVDLADLADLAGKRTADHFGLTPDSMSALVRRHGTEAPEMLELAFGRPDLLEPLVEGLPYLKVEAIWAARHEMSLTVEDLLSRRTRSVLRKAESDSDRGGRARGDARHRDREGPRRHAGRSSEVQRVGHGRPGPCRAARRGTRKTQEWNAPHDDRTYTCNPRRRRAGICDRPARRTEGPGRRRTAPPIRATAAARCRPTTGTAPRQAGTGGRSPSGGRRRARSPQRPGAVARPRSTQEVAGGARVLQRRPCPGNGLGRTLRGMRLERSRVRWGCARHDGDRRCRRHRHDILHRRRARGDLRSGAREELARRGRDPRALAAIDGPLDGGWMDRVPRRGPVLHPLREDRGHGHRPERRARRREPDQDWGNRTACRCRAPT